MPVFKEDTYKKVIADNVDNAVNFAIDVLTNRELQNAINIKRAKLPSKALEDTISNTLYIYQYLNRKIDKEIVNNWIKQLEELKDESMDKR